MPQIARSFQWYFDGLLCGLGSEGSEGSKGKVLKMDGPWTRLRREGSEGSEGSACLWQAGSKGCGLPLRAMLIKSALRDLLSVSYDMKTILLTGSLRSPPPFRLRRTSPCSGDRINRSMLSCRDMAPWLSIHSPTTKWGEGGGASHQRGIASPRPQDGCMVFAAKGGIKNGAEGAVPRQRSDTIYLPRAEPSTRPGGVSRSRTEPLAPRAKGPAAPSTLTPVRACQPSGIPESTAKQSLHKRLYSKRR